MAFPPLEPFPDVAPPVVEPDDLPLGDDDPFQFPPDPAEEDPRDPGGVPEDIPPPV